MASVWRNVYGSVVAGIASFCASLAGSLRWIFSGNALQEIIQDDFR